MRVPTSVDPVKVIPPTPRSPTSASPATAPRPVIRLTTPAGTPARSSSAIRNTADPGVSEDGLKTTALPNASAGAILRTGVTTGKFQGQIAAKTPSGSVRVEHENPASSLGNGLPPAARCSR